MRWTLLLLSFLITDAFAQKQLVPAAQAATVNLALCRTRLDHIDGSERMMGRSLARAIGDDSAPRATVRAAEMQLEQGRQQMEIQMMIAEHCPSLPENSPAGGFHYFREALDCETARLKKSTDSDAKCSLANWHGDLAPATPPQ